MYLRVSGNCCGCGGDVSHIDTVLVLRCGALCGALWWCGVVCVFCACRVRGALVCVRG
jgi:hypothetical protein